MVKMKADLLSELVAVSRVANSLHFIVLRLVQVTIMRSEFEEASNVSFISTYLISYLDDSPGVKYLNNLVAHTRSFEVFNLYAPRITLHHAHLAHALGEAERARDCSILYGSQSR